MALVLLIAHEGCDSTVVDRLVSDLPRATHDVEVVTPGDPATAARFDAVERAAAAVLPGGAPPAGIDFDATAEDEAIGRILLAVRRHEGVVGAVGADVARVVRLGFAIGRSVSAPGPRDAPLGFGAVRAPDGPVVVSDRGLVTVASPSDIDAFVRDLRKVIEVPVAQDAQTISDALEDLGRRGYDRAAKVLVDGRIECLTCHAELDASSIASNHYRRLEGASDPDDLVVIAGLDCSSCGAHMAVVLGYGPAADPSDLDVLRDLDDQRVRGS